MSEKTNEELADRVELVLARRGGAWSEADSKDLQAAADRLRQQSEEIDYMTARRAISLFNHEFVGQDGKELWAWALREARKA